MKKIILICALFIYGFLVFAQNSQSPSSMQVMIPKTAYTGDRCELKYIFHTDAALLGTQPDGERIQFLELVTDFPAFNKIEQKCRIYRATLEHTGAQYTLSLFFIPWQSGIIEFQTFDLASLVRKSQNKENSNAVFTVKLQPVTVDSLAEKMNVTALRPSKGPMIVPGTTFLLVVIAVIFVVCLALFIFAFLQIPRFLAYLVLGRNQRRIKRLYRQTERALNRTIKEKITDEVFCEEISAILRKFLSERFDKDFLILTDDKIYSKIEEISCGSLDESQNLAATNVTEVLQRCSYIRFARNSVDSKKEPRSFWEAELAEGERMLLARRCLDAAKFFAFEGQDLC